MAAKKGSKLSNKTMEEIVAVLGQANRYDLVIKFNESEIDRNVKTAEIRRYAEKVQNLEEQIRTLKIEAEKSTRKVEEGLGKEIQSKEEFIMMLFKTNEDKNNQMISISSQLSASMVRQQHLDKKYNEACVFPFIRCKIETAEALYMLPYLGVSDEFKSDFEKEMKTATKNAKETIAKMKCAGADADLFDKSNLHVKFEYHYLTWMFICKLGVQRGAIAVQNRLGKDKPDFNKRASDFSSDMALLYTMTCTIIHQYVPAMKANDVVATISDYGYFHPSLIDSVKILLEQV